MSADSTTLAYDLKRLYAAKLGKLPVEVHPFLGKLKTVPAGGSVYVQACQYADYIAQGTSATYAQAVTSANEQASSGVQFLIPVTSRINHIVRIDPATQEVSNENYGAWVDARTLEVDSGRNAATQALSSAIFRSGYGDLSTLKVGVSVAGATSITLASRKDTYLFSIGQELSVSATLTGATRALGSSGRGLIVTGRSASAGTISFGFAIDDATNGIPTIAAGDFLFIRSFRPVGSLPTRTIPIGLAGWCPTSAVTSGDSFHGVDRSVSDLLYAAQLSGGTSYFDALVAIQAEMSQRQAPMTDFLILVSTQRMGEILKENRNSTVFLPSQVSSKELQMTWDSLKLGKMNIVEDADMPNNVMYGLDMSSWSWASPRKGNKVNIDDFDGRVTRKDPATGNYQVDLFAQGNLSCERPGHNAVYSFTNALA
jgi:hypothetical protein